MVDDDVSRNNKIAFHCQFSENEAVIFAVYLIGKAINNLNSLSQNNPELRALQVDIFSNTYCMMAMGCLQELTMDQSRQYDIDAIRQVINYETTTPIKNSLLLGFLLNGPIDSKTRIMGEKIGDMIGFMFQIMNDLEPFSSKQNIICHKGSFNFDINRSRKNIVLAYIYGKCKLSEKRKLLSLGNGNDAIFFLTELYEKYDIYSVVMADIRSIESQVYALISNLQEYPLNQHCLADFQLFFNQVMKTCRDRLDVIDQPGNE
jgi:heptaprenyl diphosphate synthase